MKYQLKSHFNLYPSSLGFDDGYRFLPLIVISYPPIPLKGMGFLTFFRSKGVFADNGRLS